MALEQSNSENRMYLSITKGKLRRKVDSETPGAVNRKYELKDGTKGEKWELVFNKITGHIDDVFIKDGDFGEQLVIKMTDGSENYAITMPSDGNFAVDFLKKLKAIDLEEEVSLKPYDFEDDKGKRRRGISITQGGVKINSYYYDPAKKEAINGFPVPKGDTKKYSKSKWKVYFSEVLVFLQEELESVKFMQAPDTTTTNDVKEVNDMDVYEEEVNDDLPF